MRHTIESTVCKFSAGIQLDDGPGYIGIKTSYDRSNILWLGYETKYSDDYYVALAKALALKHLFKFFPHDDPQAINEMIEEIEYGLVEARKEEEALIQSQKEKLKQNDGENSENGEKYIFESEEELLKYVQGKYFGGKNEGQ